MIPLHLSDMHLSRSTVSLCSIESSFLCTTLFALMMRMVTGDSGSGVKRSGRYKGGVLRGLSWKPILSISATFPLSSWHHKTLNTTAFTPHPILPLNGCDPPNTQTYFECDRDLVNVSWLLPVWSAHPRLPYVRENEHCILCILTYRLVWLCVF